MRCRLSMSLLQESLYAMQLTMWSPQVTIFMQLDKTVTTRKKETFTSLDSAKVKHFSENIWIIGTLNLHLTSNLASEYI